MPKGDIEVINRQVDRFSWWLGLILLVVFVGSCIYTIVV